MDINTGQRRPSISSISVSSDESGAWEEYSKPYGSKISTLPKPIRNVPKPPPQSAKPSVKSMSTALPPPPPPPPPPVHNNNVPIPPPPPMPLHKTNSAPAGVSLGAALSDEIKARQEQVSQTVNYGLHDMLKPDM